MHAKSFGLIAGELVVRSDLPPWLAQGLFATPSRRPALIRFSSLSGDILPDAVSLPRGLAIKVLDVDGTRLPDAPETRTQDFVLANSRTFNGRNARLFLWALRRLSRIAERGEGAKIAVSRIARRLEQVLEKTGRESPELKAVGGQPTTHPLGDAFFSQLPLRFGVHVAKLALIPSSPELQAAYDAPLAHADAHDAVRRAIDETIRRHGAAWRVAVQLSRNISQHPVEDGADDWDEATNPFFEVAELRVPPQRAWLPDSSPELDARIGFSPWNGIEAHRPMGSLMRLRRLSYQQSRQVRARRNGISVAEPSAEDLRRLATGA